MTTALKEYNEIKFPFQQNEELYEKLKLIGEIDQGQSESDEMLSEFKWHQQFSSSDSMRSKTYEVALNKLNIGVTREEFDLTYPAVDKYFTLTLAEDLALEIHKSSSTIYFAKLYLAECPDIDCYYEAIGFLEELDLSEEPESFAVGAYLVLGALHYMCQNQSLACRTIEKACIVDEEQSDSLWDFIQYLAENPTDGNRICTCQDF